MTDNFDQADDPTGSTPPVDPSHHRHDAALAPVNQVAQGESHATAAVTLDSDGEPSLVDLELSTPAGRASMAAAKLAAQVMNLLELAKAKSGLTQAEIAQRLDVTEGRVSQVLNGDGNFKVATVARFLSALDVAPSLTATDKSGQFLRRNRRRQASRSALVRTPIDAFWLASDGVQTTRAHLVHDARVSLLSVDMPRTWRGADAADYQRDVEKAVAAELKAESR